MSGLEKPFKNSIKKSKKISKSQCQNAISEQKTTSDEHQILTQLLNSSEEKSRLKTPLAFSFYFLFWRDQNHHSKLT